MFGGAINRISLIYTHVFAEVDCVVDAFDFPILILFKYKERRSMYMEMFNPL